jgi:hypothetical protein
VLGNADGCRAIIFEPHPFVGFGVFQIVLVTHVFAPN